MTEDPLPQAKIRVALVFGGRSTEHAISCVSAGSVLRAIDRETYDVVPVGITTEGRWVLAADDPERLAISDGKLPEVDALGTSVVLAADPTTRALQVQEPGSVPTVLSQVDVVFPLLHGPYGEDGTIQGLLELAGVPYVGSGVLASAQAMDKAVMKTMLRSAGLPVGPYAVVSDRDWRSRPQQVLADIEAGLSLPVFVKPARAGSSLGIVKVKSWAALPAAIETARRHDPKVVVEQGVVAREIECGVLERADGSGPEASVVAEIRVVGDHEFYDFEAKYLDDVTELDVPADLPEPVSELLRTKAIEAYQALSCEGYARVDFFLLTDGEGLADGSSSPPFLVNELNTIPGFTPVSMFPLMWAGSGLAYRDLVDRLLRDALRRGTGLR
jgi:D-alanine-D-alanine ligase